MMGQHHSHRTRVLFLTLAAILVVCTLGSGRVAAQFTITEIIDSTGDGAGNGLLFPGGIAVDAAGNVYVTGLISDNAFKITPAGVVTEIIDATGDGAGNGLDSPGGIAADAAGNVYMTGAGSDNAFKITPAGLITEIIDATGDGVGNDLDRPVGIAVDAAGNAYVTGLFSDNAFKITPAGVVTEIIDGANGLDGASPIAVDPAGNVYVAGAASNNAFKITPAGVITEIIDAAGDGAGNGLDGPGGIAVDAAGNAYVTGEFSRNAFKITPIGVITEIIGAGNGLLFPGGIAVDAAGNAYVTGRDGSFVDGGIDNAFKITPAGLITEIIDSTGDGAGNTLNEPRDIAVDAVGRAFVTGRFSNNAFKITTDCNNNGILDTCDIACGPPAGLCDLPGCGTSQDCNANGIPDDCEPDCNGNDSADSCDIANGTSNDCNLNGIPDDCEPDCNVNGIADECDIADLTSQDCNNNVIPDECELSTNDCNGNAVPDDCEPGGIDDCNSNGIADLCDLFTGNSPDCNSNGMPDECEVSSFTQQAKLTAADAAAFDNFGESVSISGNTAVFGSDADDDAGDNSGSAYVFVLSSGVWTQQAKLTADDAAPGDLFGDSVSISSNTAVIGARLDDDAGDNSGSAYVFARSGGVWTQQAKLTADDAAAGDEFGNSVSVSGDTAVIGARRDDASSGSAYVFVRTGGVWTQQAKLTAADAAAGDEFSFSVSISGDTAVIGAWRDDAWSGSAYVFVRTGGVWTQQAKLTAADASEADRFGFSVSISGDTAVIGARFGDGAAFGSGSAYVFFRTGGAWTQTAKLTAADAAAADEFGFSVSISGDTAVIGARLDDDAGGNSGSAYIFVRSGGVWSQQAKLTAPDGADFDLFGNSVSISGDTAVIGSTLDDDAGSSSGSAYVFIRSSDCNTNGIPDECEAGLALDIPRFTGVLLGTNIDPVDVCQADVNGNGVVNGLDIQPFVDRLLGP